MALEQAHSERFRKVSTRYPRRVAEAYGATLTERWSMTMSGWRAPSQRGNEATASNRVTGEPSASPSATRRVHGERRNRTGSYR